MWDVGLDVGLDGVDLDVWTSLLCDTVDRLSQQSFLSFIRVFISADISLPSFCHHKGRSELWIL